MAPSIWAAPVIMFSHSRRGRAVNVGVVAVGRFVFHVGGVDGDAARLFFRRCVDLVVVALASPPNFLDNTVAIAAVNVVLPWSTCPIVPTFTCGLVRSNFPLPCFDSKKGDKQRWYTDPAAARFYKWCPWRESGPATSPLPRACSTTEPHGQNLCHKRFSEITGYWAGDGNRTSSSY